MLKQNSNECIPINMLILLILLDVCVQGWSKTSIVYFTSGNNVTLVCPLNTSVENITWRKSNDIINDADNKINHMILNNEKYSVLSNQSNRNMLHIRMANEDEVGEYYCETTINKYIKEESLQLVKKVTPNVSVLLTPNSTVYEGTNVTFECMHDVTSTTVVNWFKNGYIIPSFKTNLEIIDSITRFDGGEYSCRVMGNKQTEYGFGKVSLNVLYSPDVVVIDYDNGTLFCNASGNPDEYTYGQWEHRSIINNQIRYLNGTENGHLHFTDLNSEPRFYYNGIYTCFAENGVIRNDMLYQRGFQHIEFKGIPQCLQYLIFEDYIQAQSTEIFIKLYTVPIYDSFHWKTSTESITNISTKYDTTVTGSDFITMLYDEVAFEIAVWKFSLVIYDLNQEDFDIYTLQVENKIGNISCSVRLQPTSRRYFSPIVIFMFACGAAITVVLVMNVIQHFVNSRKIARHNIMRKPSNTDDQSTVLYRHRAGQEFTEITLNETDGDRTHTIEDD
ncbi:limbic system-associated membrane protein-like [Mytilus edulis]|uniref:limbic system-associated membrane protein-like n=1 Tax=Mytilus edulis TaxID=6550 RepID=UPI0039EEBC23